MNPNMNNVLYQKIYVHFKVGIKNVMTTFNIRSVEIKETNK